MRTNRYVDLAPAPLTAKENANAFKLHMRLLSTVSPRVAAAWAELSDRTAGRAREDRAVIAEMTDDELEALRSLLHTGVLYRRPPSKGVSYTPQLQRLEALQRIEALIVEKRMQDRIHQLASEPPPSTRATPSSG